MLQLLGILSHRLPIGALPLDSTGGLLSPKLPTFKHAAIMQQIKHCFQAITRMYLSGNARQIAEQYIGSWCCNSVSLVKPVMKRSLFLCVNPDKWIPPLLGLLVGDPIKISSRYRVEKWLLKKGTQIGTLMCCIEWRYDLE